MKKNKYHNKKIKIDGIVFASKGESQRYIELKEFKRMGEIEDFILQPQFLLQPKFKKNGKLYREIKYIADFKVIYPDGHTEIEDVKGKGGYTTPEFVLKHKMFEYKYPELHLEIIQKSGKGMEIFDEQTKEIK